MLLDGTEYLGRAIDGGSMDAHRPGDALVPPTDGEPDSTAPNMPPVLTTVALDRYDPIVGEVLRAIPGPILDPDGDRAFVRFEWSRNGVALDGMSTGELDTTGLTGGDTIALEAWAYDGRDDGPRVRIGPFALLSDTTRWRQLAPDALGEQSTPLVYDAPHRRFVRYHRGQLWEYRIEGSAVRVARLTATGEAPDADAPFALHDEAGRRLLVFTSTFRDAYVADLTTRGTERWTRVPLGGDSVPDYRLAPTLAFDASGPRVWMYGGFSRDRGVHRDLWSLELATDTWVQHPMSGVPVPPLFGAAMAILPGAREALLVGGTEAFTSLSPRTYRLTLGAAVVDVSDGPALAVASYAASALGTSTGAIFAGGATTLNADASATPVLLYDAETEELVMGPGPSVRGGFGVLAIDPDDTDGLLWWPGSPIADPDDGTLSLLRVSPMDGSTTLLASQARPGQVQQAVAGQTETAAFVLFGGYAIGDDGQPGLWRFDGDSSTWSLLSTSPDLATMRSPPERFWGAVLGAGGGPSELSFVGGRNAGGPLPLDVLQLEHGTGRWLDRTARVTSAPVARFGHSAIGVRACGGVAYVFGGYVGSRPMNDAWILECTATRDCAWRRVDDAGAPTPRGHATWAIVRGGSVSTTSFLFGGRTELGASNEIFGLDVCARSPVWSSPSMLGTPPSPRFGHSMTVADVRGVSATDLYVMGGAAVDDDPATYTSDVHLLQALDENEVRWTPITAEGTPPSPRIHHAAGWDAVQRRLIVFGGFDGRMTRGDLWELRIR